MSLYVPKRQVELQTAMVDEDMEPEEREACEEVMLQSIIEASLKEYKDDIVEKNLGVALARPRHVSEVDEQVFQPKLEAHAVLWSTSVQTSKCRISLKRCQHLSLSYLF